MGTTEPRLRVAVVTLGDPRWLHALAEPFNKTLRDRGLAEHCCFLRLSRLGRIKGLTATLQSYICRRRSLGGRKILGDTIPSSRSIRAAFGDHPLSPPVPA